MAEREDLPEEIVLNILSRLPVKSLIRFTSVSKRLHSIILHDPKFGRSQFQATRPAPRLLCSTNAPLLESLDLDDTASFGKPSSVRKLSFSLADCITPLGSYNGLVFLASDEYRFYIWNPSTGFLKQLPDLPHSGNSIDKLWYFGTGYSDDYKVLVAADNSDDQTEMKMFSLKANVWKNIQHCDDYKGVSGQGDLLNEAIHWVNETDMVHDNIVVFDFRQEEFRTMQLPDNDHDFRNVGVYEGCLCVCGALWSAKECVEFWVMREYNVNDSWTKLRFSVDLADLPFSGFAREFLIMEGSRVVGSWIDEGLELEKIDNEEDEKYMLKGDRIFMTGYEESLLWITGYHPIEEKASGN